MPLWWVCKNTALGSELSQSANMSVDLGLPSRNLHASLCLYVYSPLMLVFAQVPAGRCLPDGPCGGLCLEWVKNVLSVHSSPNLFDILETTLWTRNKSLLINTQAGAAKKAHLCLSTWRRVGWLRTYLYWTAGEPACGPLVDWWSIWKGTVHCRQCHPLTGWVSQ